MTRKPFFFTVTVIVAVAASLSTVVAADDGTGTPPDSSAEASEKQLDFVRQKVVPLLQARCFECHGNAKEARGGLRLNSRRAMLSGGESGAAVVPGKPDESLLIEAVRYESFEMPPRTRMPKQEVDILVRWISEGAVWPADLETAAVPDHDSSFPLEARRRSHWAWQPISHPEIPDVRDDDWARDSLDRFILAELEKAGLTPARDADRRTLLRRVFFDLTGLPPSIEDVEAFVSDPAGDDQALATVVDRLLNSPHFGERWARHWLDLVRYAETLGHEFDYPLHHAWRYRDYVIRAFNQDVPYDQFVREHIAGDLLPDPRRHPIQHFNESVIGTGFWFLCEDKHAPVDVRAEEAAKIDNQIDVFSKTFLGMTVACARCHDHKFDAISTKDYYALAGFLQSSRRATAWLDPDQQIADRMQQLTTLRQRTDKQLLKLQAEPESADRLSRYVMAALEVIQGTPTPDELTQRTETIFEDFESTALDGWEVSGDAFADGTAAGTLPGQQPVSGFQGQRLVNSWRGSDRPQGALRSAEFSVTLPFISFYIGGGAHKDNTCVNLVVDGRTVRTATGRNNEQLLPESWDVSEFLGRTARIEIIDHSTEAWGHINVDHIVFGSHPPAADIGRHPDVVAREQNCDVRLLHQWVDALRQKPNTAEDQILSLPATLAQSDSSRSLTATARHWAGASDTDRRPSETVLGFDLRAGIPEDWFTTGQAFERRRGDSDIQSDIQLEWRNDRLHCGQAAGVSSATWSNELRGTLASPTFELQHPEILILAAGEGTRVRLVIDGYVMHEFNQLLFNGARQDINTDGEFRWIRLAADVHRYQGHRMYLEFLDEGDGWFVVQEIRFAERPEAAAPAVSKSDLNRQLAEQLLAAEQPDGPPTTADLQAVISRWAQTVVSRPELYAALLADQQLFDSRQAVAWEQLVAEWRAAATGMPEPLPVLAITEGTEENERVFIRGNHRNLGEEADRMILTALRQPSEPAITKGSGRLELAEQLLSDHNPLPARVAVNRLWYHLFGRGIVASTDNFGVLGQPPSHPELLDHLAFRFRDGGWSVKTMIRTLMLSRTYRISSERSESADQADPTNRLFHRANIRRLQGEAVRDSILTVSGRLDPKLFGPPVPVHLTEFMQGRGRPGVNGPLDGNGRRSVYISVNRNFLSPFMLAFDVPAPVTTTGNRTVSNVPAQALILLNNQFVNQQSEIWAQKLLATDAADTSGLLQRAWYELFGRPAEPQELQPLLEFARAAEPAEGRLSVKTLTDICHVLLNSKEFLFLR
ncbi:MAG: PSD1 and planctomycete cytochrome C domain-containing protein [Fuerstiella sp.]